MSPSFSLTGDNNVHENIHTGYKIPEIWQPCFKQQVFPFIRSSFHVFIQPSVQLLKESVYVTPA